MKLARGIWLAGIIGGVLGAPERRPSTAELLDSCTSSNEWDFSLSTESSDDTKQSHLHRAIEFPSESQGTSPRQISGQVYLHGPVGVSADDSDVASGSEPTLEVVRHGSTVWYSAQRQVITPKIRYAGPGSVGRIVLETPDLSAFNITIGSVYGSCPETSRGSTRIRCDWQKVSPGFFGWNDIGLYLSTEDDAELELPFTLTSYAGDKVVATTKTTLRWTTRRPLRYVQRQPELFPQPRTLVLPALPAADSERSRLKQAFTFADFHCTGFYLNPGTPLHVQADGVQPDGPLPQFLVGTPALVDPAIDSERLPNTLEQLPTMANGSHTVSSALGGILYVRFTAREDGEEVGPVTITLHDRTDAAQPFPFVREGITTDEEYQAMLAATTVPFAELSGRRVIVTGLAQDARPYAEQGQMQARLFRFYGEMIEAQDRLSGLLPDEQADTVDRASPLRPMVVQTRRGVNPNSYHWRAAIPRERHREVWGEYHLRRSWMMWHELGHQRQQTPIWSWTALTEVTVNLYSLAVLRLSDPEARGRVAEWNQAKAYLARPAADKDFDKAGFYVSLVMFEQLRVIFGDSFYHRLHHGARRASPQATDADKKHYFLTQTAHLVKEDLTDYFTRWGLRPEPRSVAEMKKHPKPTEDYTKRPVYGGTGL
ncbi:hypothetical protein BO86DRAFT_306518 [Aspergillus japonicus CBS 114.51]|uniref:Peptidase M60 domain-containing protein n=1 Tax=Aspergillus japonicus CBS 114.51 TaxID=1448312 RepID=A0A8T8X987_ASPJA|nr:hypothetical protein BO86DRAFT_306518 [Aspergillus japonicus CBS 114.51]RAH84585.1 hypothetical protein BO86DRAFT_306518 [Aspergillus japonicus CBS 114.51]